MRILAIGDLHGDLGPVHEALDRYRLDALLCCGDWGDPGELDAARLAALTDRLPVLTTFGNHDDLTLLAGWRNRDGSPALLAQGEVRDAGGVRVAAIGGIWARSHRKPFYVTDADVAGLARRIADAGPVDVLLTHGCPIGMADRTPSGRRGGQRCFLDAFEAIRPRVHLCGHLHVAQEKSTKDGRRVINVGATPEGTAALIEGRNGSLTARLERFR